MSTVLLFLLGGLTGLASGYLGIGGGIILVPVLKELFQGRGLPLDQVMTYSFATSLFTAIFTTGSSAWKQWRQDNLILIAVPSTAAGALLGGQAGAWLGSNLTGELLQAIFGWFLLLSGINLAGNFLKPKNSSTGSLSILRKPSKIFGLFVLGLATGVIGALLGVGGGVVMVPAFIFLFGIPSGKVAGTSSAIAFLLAISGVIGYLMYGDQRSVNPAGFWGVVELSIAIPIVAGTLITAQIGAKLNKLYGGEVYKRIFGVFLMIVGARMIFF